MITNTLRDTITRWRTGMDHTSHHHWQNARTLTHLGELTAAWLTGELQSQPTYHGPCDVDTEPGLRLALIHLNRHGMVTTSSQAGKFIKGDTTGE